MEAARYPQSIRVILEDYVSSLLLHKPADVYTFTNTYFHTFHHNKHSPQMDHKPLPVVITGPSGVGKGTLINRLIQDHPNKFGFSVSHTTRKPRPGEEDGAHYHFTTLEVMKKEVEEGKFVEHAQVHSNMYGTSKITHTHKQNKKKKKKAAVEKVINAGKICVLDIDVQGAEQVKKSSLTPKYVFIQPPSMEELEKRLRGRGTEDEASVNKRLTNAKGEMEYTQRQGFFDLIVTNDELETAYKKLLDFILTNCYVTSKA